MRRRLRKRRVLKWICTVGCVVLLSLWGAAWLPRQPWGPQSYRGRTLVFKFEVDRGYYCFRLETAHAPAFWRASVALPRDRLLPDWVYRSPIEWEHSPPQMVYMEPPARQFVDHAHAFQDQSAPQTFQTGESWSLFVAAWIPFLLLAIPTAFLWYHDRRFPPGQCRRCGYNLTGNVSGRCPECGEPIGRGQARDIESSL